ncbi:UCH-domain-containing protein, partial [Aureobasidium melanogenum]
MTLIDDDQCKLSIPLVRPENENTFNSLFISSLQPMKPQEMIPEEQSQLNGLGQTELNTPSNELTFDDEPLQPVTNTIEQPTEKPVPEEDVSTDRLQPSASKVVRLENKDMSSTQSPAAATPAASPSIWSNWRRETSSQSINSEAGGIASKNKDSGYQRRDAGIKVLRPTRSSGRTFSSGSVASSPAGEGRSRYFDDGKKKVPDTVAGDEKVTRDNPVEPVTSKTRSNPAGGASAFSWLHSGNRA